MCDFIKGNKLEFADGTTVDLKDLRIGDLTPRQINDLNNCPASKFDILVITDHMGRLADAIEKIENKKEKEWKAFMTKIKDIGIIIGITYYIASTIKITWF